MPKLVHKNPEMRNHRGRARVRINGRVIYLGVYDSSEAHRKYSELLDVYQKNDRQIPPDWVPTEVSKKPAETVTVTPEPAPKTPTIAELVDQFLTWANARYTNKSGQKTGESGNLRDAVLPLKTMFGDIELNQFGPMKLREVRDHFISSGIARRTINNRVRRIRQFVRWCVGRELCDPTLLMSLECVEALAPNQGGVETSGTRGNVEWSTVDATLPHLPPMIQSFVMVLWHTGARVGEIAKLTTGMIDRTAPIWIADLLEHKNSCREKKRRIYFCVKAQEELTPWLLENPDEIIFSPRRVDNRQELRTDKSRAPGRSYSRAALNQCLRRAIKRAGNVPAWNMAQIRHSVSCRVTDEFGLEAASQFLGHSSVRMTSHYSREANAAALRVAEQIQ